MNTEDRSISLRSGQALVVDRFGSATLYLAEGELLLQAPATWLAGTVVIAPARRVLAPALLDAREIASAVAVGAVKVRVQRAAGLLARLTRWWSERRLATLAPAARMR